MFFIIWCLELHLSAIENIVTFIFPAEIPQRFAWEDKSEIKFLQFFINDSMKAPLIMAGTVPEFYSIVTTLFKEVSEFMWNSYWMNLIGVYQKIKNSFGSVNGICGNNDLFYFRNTCGFIYATSYSKEFCFGCCDVYCMINCLNDWTVIYMNMGDWGGDTILYAGICYNNDCIQLWWYLESGIFKIM